MQLPRKSQSDCFRYFIRTIRLGQTGKVSAEQLVRVLVKEANYEKAFAAETVKNALHDGLLKQVGSGGVASPRARSISESKQLRLPEINEVASCSHDCYCYECHLPGVLEHCRQCTRSFHRLCYRKVPERPRYSVPSPKLQKNRLPVFSSDTDSDDDTAHCGESTTLEYESDARAASSVPPDQASLNSWTHQRYGDDITADSTSSHHIANEDSAGKALAVDNLESSTKLYAEDVLEGESKSKVDVVFMGEVRPPTRKRPATTTASIVSYKSEVSPHEEENNDIELCTCCRLLKHAALRNPPDLQADELCHLVGYTFERNRSWVGNDVHSYLDGMKLSVQDVELAKKLLFKGEPNRLEEIELKLRRQQYSLLSEFLVDILDVQHSIGVFFGAKSFELEATKWLVRGVTHDLSEIRRCPDCFRYSYEKHSSIWFAKPCVQRHELVFAKHMSFPYWPAKVIRVLPNNKYDVRFFGGNHSRALIDAQFIRPIDTDVKTLKLGNTPAIKKAMEELRYHQILSLFPASTFSFHADKNETERLVHMVLGHEIPTISISDEGNQTSTTALRRGRPRKRKNTMNTERDSSDAEIFGILVPQSDELNNTSATILNDVQGWNTSTKRLRSNRNTTPRGDEKRVTRSTNSASNSMTMKEVKENLKKALQDVVNVKKRNEELLGQIAKLKETIGKQERDQKVLKSKQWCYWCLNEAIYLCCFRAAYCSRECQSRHWKDGHNKVCKNQDDQRHATSTIY